MCMTCWSHQRLASIVACYHGGSCPYPFGTATRLCYIIHKAEFGSTVKQRRELPNMPVDSRRCVSFWFPYQ